MGPLQRIMQYASKNDLLLYTLKCNWNWELYGNKGVEEKYKIGYETLENRSWYEIWYAGMNVYRNGMKIQRDPYMVLGGYFVERNQSLRNIVSCSEDCLLGADYVIMMIVTIYVAYVTFLFTCTNLQQRCDIECTGNMLPMPCHHQLSERWMGWTMLENYIPCQWDF